ncbi:alanyl-tRNA editing protein [Halalkalicoccus jeotgali]|uniref:Alanyl-tRNA synthetase, class IIc-like protein n=1 Tax=Halalkalicoccus jeotgali (strain DSM 18796 / CECT 7217 / JCM 14584 / KCTC 4019 / B3) TaxID=795797 RepID=D8J690_HALJB|nr:alanyl-tRNA editing protein [Halalkalicoccus jeotgali]ADJ15808.1 Alanyl-tRNA synthetase, class IIc-like protein [Halalkalicoccus jeotgali B3]ELY37168.1 Alanyl-tRNA synthetase, class IIc-like protein [Halalkalicoccus jeotgali B3]
MTDPLYLGDPTVREFEARVERVIDDGDAARVVLDATHFYPEGGGQPADRGALSGSENWPVRDVRKTDEIYHTVEGEGPTVGERVVGEIDREHRAAHMQYHTAQHLLSAVLLEEYDAPTTGNQLYADHARLDCAYERFTDEDLDALETRMNELVGAAMDVRWYTLGRERAQTELDPERTRLDLLPESITEIRIVEIGDGIGSTPNGEPSGPSTVFDRVACAGTHVSNTAEIGRVEVTGRRTQGSDEERVEFVLVDE